MPSSPNRNLSPELSLPPLGLPPFTPRLRASEVTGVDIYDPLRGKFVALTPEEYVRQAFVAYLTTALGYPAGLMANEVSLRFNGMSRRCDTVLFDKQRHPLMIVEYKAPSVPITRRVFDQILRYNSVLSASWLVVSNGMNHYCCRTLPDGSVRFLDTIPDYSAL